MPIRDRPLIPVIRKYTAANDPQALKRPGVIAVEPRNDAANAGKRKLTPDCGSAAPLVPAYNIPAKAPKSDPHTNEPNRNRSTFKPDSREMRRPRPTNSSWRPIGVYLSTYQSRNVRITA